MRRNEFLVQRLKRKTEEVPGCFVANERLACVSQYFPFFFLFFGVRTSTS